MQPIFGKNIPIMQGGGGQNVLKGEGLGVLCGERQSILNLGKTNTKLDYNKLKCTVHCNK